MQKKLTITVDAEVYDGFHAVVGRRRISRFLNDLARPLVVDQDLRAGYAAMAADEAREAEADEWTEGLVGLSRSDAQNRATRWSAPMIGARRAAKPAACPIKLPPPTGR